LATAGLFYIEDIHFENPKINILSSLKDGVKNISLFNHYEYAGSSDIRVGRQDRRPSEGYYNQTYTWSYSGYTNEYSIGIPGEMYDYYKNQTHRSHQFDRYALTDRDRVVLNEIGDKFKEMGDERGYSDEENIMNLISFIQAIPYALDSVTTGFEEYPRYPIETLADGCGDCEDTAILAAALLYEMGYDVVLLEFPQHLALGIAGGEKTMGAYYEYNDTKYFYVETTTIGWKIGEVPDDIDSSIAMIHPMKKR